MLEFRRREDYVWLPIKFENDVPKIYWLDEWKIPPAIEKKPINQRLL
jgi:hypothetical protein